MFSIIVMLGPGTREQTRFCDMIKSVAKNEHCVSDQCNLIVITDNSNVPTDELDLKNLFYNFDILNNPLTAISNNS